MSLCRDNQALKLMGWLTVSIYVYSAISKIDYQFAETTGQEFLRTMIGLAGSDSNEWSVELRRAPGAAVACL